MLFIRGNCNTTTRATTLALFWFCNDLINLLQSHSYTLYWMDGWMDAGGETAGEVLAPFVYNISNVAIID